MKLTREILHKLLDRELDKKGFKDEVIVDRWGKFSFGIEVNVINGDVSTSLGYLHTTSTEEMRTIMAS